MCDNEPDPRWFVVTMWIIGVMGLAGLFLSLGWIIVRGNG